MSRVNSSFGGIFGYRRMDEHRGHHMAIALFLIALKSTYHLSRSALKTKHQFMQGTSKEIFPEYCFKLSNLKFDFQKLHLDQFYQAE